MTLEQIIAEWEENVRYLETTGQVGKAKECAADLKNFRDAVAIFMYWQSQSGRLLTRTP
jgi:hypothetical protein